MKQRVENLKGFKYFPLYLKVFAAVISDYSLFQISHYGCEEVKWVLITLEVNRFVFSIFRYVLGNFINLAWLKIKHF